jgi:hypothetical protein
LCKLTKIPQRILADGIHDFPIDRFVVMHRDVSKTDSLSQSLAGFLRNRIEFLQLGKNVTHGLRQRLIRRTDDMTAYIHTDLHSAREVYYQDILQINISNQIAGIWGVLSSMRWIQRRSDSNFSAIIT